MVANEQALYLTPAASVTCDSVPTRSSLLSRLRNVGDEASWRFFFETYWRLIYNVARKSGLTDSDAQDIVQETVIAMARKMPDFRYDPAKGSFKQWLLLVTRRRIHDHFRRAYRAQALLGEASSAGGSDPENLEQVPSPALAPDAEIDAAWETEWRESFFQAALARVRQRANPKQYQAFDYCVLQGLKASEAGRRLGLSAAQVYLAKHRISVAVKRAAQELEREAAPSAGLGP
jgi:RNA polymerase sigma-70 factor (ECF subfamily)